MPRPRLSRPTERERGSPSDARSRREKLIPLRPHLMQASRHTNFTNYNDVLDLCDAPLRIIRPPAASPSRNWASAGTVTLVTGKSFARPHSGVRRRRTPRCNSYNLEFLLPRSSHSWSAAASSRGNQEKSYRHLKPVNATKRAENGNESRSIIRLGGNLCLGPRLCRSLLSR